MLKPLLLIKGPEIWAEQNEVGMAKVPGLWEQGNHRKPDRQMGRGKEKGCHDALVWKRIYVGQYEGL